MSVVESMGITDVGKKRTGNEDTFFIDDDMGLYMVADGMGGHNAGEVASKIVVDATEAGIMTFIRNPGAETRPADDHGLSAAASRLNAAVHLANQEVFTQARSNPAYMGMGSTLSALYLTEDTFIVVNVGDSPVYLLRNGTISLISVVHSMAAEYNALAPEGAKPLAEIYHHVITRAMGIEATVQPDTREIQWMKNDRVVICSDGLSDLVAPEEILEIAGKNALKTVCRRLVDLANERGGTDNITVVVVAWDGP